MPFLYSTKERECEPNQLPDIEVFHEYGDENTTGYYWWFCMPGYLTNDEPTGPFETFEAAVADALEQND